MNEAPLALDFSLPLSLQVQALRKEKRKKTGRRKLGAHFTPSELCGALI